MSPKISLACAARNAAASLFLILALAACGSDQSTDQTISPEPETTSTSFLGLFGDSPEDAGPTIGVNAYLWRATLDTLSFMPLASADTVSGIITTDWYTTPENPNERVKITAYVLDRRLRADAIRVSVFRQVNTSGMWADTAADPDVAPKIENAILTRARQLKIGTAGG